MTHSIYIKRYNRRIYHDLVKVTTILSISHFIDNNNVNKMVVCDMAIPFLMKDMVKAKHY